MENIAEKCAGRINALSLGATREQGGTRTSTVTIGGECVLPFLHFEGEMPHRAAIAIDIEDAAPEDWAPELEKRWSDVWGNAADWAQKAVEELKVDLVSINLKRAHPDNGAKSIDDEVRLVRSVLERVGVPLIVWNTYDITTDNKLMPAIAEALKDENCLLGVARQENYKTLVAAALAHGHMIITESPIDVNIQKQVNILCSEMGFPLENMVIYPTTGALGYGFEYLYSIQERGRIAGLQGDRVLAMPVIAFTSADVWKVKEAVQPEAVSPGWGNEKTRGILWELITATTLLQSGVEILVLRHPDAIRGAKRTIEELMKK